MPSKDSQGRRGGARRSGIGRAWIVGSLAIIVVSSGIAYVIGRASATAASASPLVSSMSTTPALTSSPSGASPSDTVSDGTQIVTYRLVVANGYSITLTDTTASAVPVVSGNVGSGDLYSEPGFETYVPVGAAKQLFALKGNAAPTYPACKASTLFVGRIPITVGTTFCLSEGDRMIGGTIAAVNGAEHGNSTVIFTVWKDTSSR